MASSALVAWRTANLARLNELETVHTAATGTSRGRRWGTVQLNRSLFVALVAQFQAFCRNLHDEAVAFHELQATPNQQVMLRTLLKTGRKLDSQNPRKSALGADFGRLGFDFITALQAHGANTILRLDRLEFLVDFRNAIGHGNESTIAHMTSTGRIASTKTSYRSYRSTLNGLAGTMDSTVADRLASLLGVAKPW